VIPLDPSLECGWPGGLLVRGKARRL